MPQAVPQLPAALQHIVKAHQIGTYVGIRVDYGVPYPRLSGQMHHQAGPVLVKQSLNGLPVGHIRFVEHKSAVLCPPLDSRQPVSLENGVIIIIHVVHAHHNGGCGILQQPFHQAAADKARRPGNQNCLTVQIDLLHGFHLPVCLLCPNPAEICPGYRAYPSHPPDSCPSGWQ